MASYNINDILGGPNLVGMIQATTSGIPDPFPAEFYRVDGQVDGDTGEYTVFTGQRGTATMSAYGAPSKNAQFKNVGKQAVKLIHSIESISLPISAYINLLAYNDLSKQRLGIAEVTRQIKEFKRRFANLRVAAMTSALFSGQIYFDASGNLLPTSTGAATTVNYSVPSGNVGHLDPFNTGTPILGGTAWSNASANIDQQIQALLQAAVQLTGYELKHAFYGKNIPHYLTSNTNLGNYFYRNQSFNNGFVETADIPNPLLGLTWHKAYYSFFQDQNGNNQTLVGNDQILFTPDPSPEWIGVLEGSYAVPTDVGRVGPGEGSVVDRMQIAHGMFAYGRQTDDPVTAKIVAGDTFLPAIKNPQAIYIATVV
jgi:major capsid protein E